MGELDLFLDEDITYAQGMLRAGVPVELHVYPGAFHGSDNQVSRSMLSRRWKADERAALDRALNRSEGDGRLPTRRGGLVTQTPSERTLDLDGATLRYVVEGAGDAVPIAFAHGWCSKLEHWSPQAEHLRHGRRVVRWDRRGWAGRRRPRRRRTPSVMPTTSPPSSTARASSGSWWPVTPGVAPPRWRSRRPTRAGPPASSSSTRRCTVRRRRASADRFAEGIERSTQRLSGSDGPAYFDRMYRSFFGPRADPATVDDAVANALGTPLPIVVGRDAPHRRGRRRAGGGVTCPVLWVSAQPDDTAAVLATFPAASPAPFVGHVVGSGHFVQLEVPEQLNPMLDLFLDTLDGGTA